MYRLLPCCNQSQSAYPYDRCVTFSDAIWQNRYGKSDSCFAAVYPYGRPQLFMGMPAAEKEDKSVAEECMITAICKLRISMYSGMISCWKQSDVIFLNRE